jgi:hypothetical protein
MGLPSGVLWAPCNIDVEQPGGFAKSPFQYDCSFFSWGNIDGHNPTSPSSFSPWSWGGINNQAPWYEGQIYGNTPGNTLTVNIPVGEEFDAARANIGAPWRLPTGDEYRELFDNIIYIDASGTEVDTTRADKRVTVNSIVGIYIQSRINGARLFFACSGFGTGTTRSYIGSHGFYWSSLWISGRYARGLRFLSSGVFALSDNLGRCFGFALRPVMVL